MERYFIIAVSIKKVNSLVNMDYEEKYKLSAKIGFEICKEMLIY